MIDPEKLTENWPKELDSNGLSDSQKEGVTILTETWNRLGDGDKRKLAYLLATVWHECDKTMQPIEEYGKGSKRPYGKLDPKTNQAYFGRGYVQITWKENYERFGKLLKIDLVNRPELALDPKISATIAVRGMITGGFTGRKLGHYFTKNVCDWENARRIINKLDKAELISGYAQIINAAL
jgi:putative chitinase